MNLHIYAIHPLHLLQNPPTKDSFKKLVKSRVLDYWEKKLRTEAFFLPSLRYFHPNFMSLSTPHWLWRCAGSNVYEVSKARYQLLFLSRQYPCAERTRHWSENNKLGLCSHPPCSEMGLVESPEHILLKCSAYHLTRLNLIAAAMCTRNPTSHALFIKHLFSNEKKMMQFLVDPSSIPEVISGAQLYGNDLYNDLFYIGRTWCYSLHREKSKRLGKWNFKD